MKVLMIKIVVILVYLVSTINLSLAQQGIDNLFLNGTILSSDNGTLRAELKLSEKAYDEYVVGVYYSEEKIENSPTMVRLPVISGGVSYVRYNAENGIIKRGDLVTSSSEPGVGMKATEPGMILGVALEDAGESGDLLKIRLSIQYMK